MRHLLVVFAGLVGLSWWLAHQLERWRPLEPGERLARFRKMLQEP